jgi:uncharacterized cupredoxin-like copper-binding protein
MSLRLKRQCAAGAACAVLVLTLVGCGTAGANRAGPVRLVKIEERDFAIKAPHSLEAGVMRFVVKNMGPVSHELLLVRMPSTGLPMRRDGLTIDEDALGANIVGVLEPAGPGAERGVRARLEPGSYVFLCNMAGHYMSGMSSKLTVL